MFILDSKKQAAVLDALDLCVGTNTLSCLVQFMLTK